MGQKSLVCCAAAFAIANIASAQVVLSESFEEFDSGEQLNGLVTERSVWNAYPNWSISEPAESGCFADLSSNFVVNGEDLAQLLANWSGNDAAADLNGDGVVNGADLAQMLAVWGACEGQPGGLSMEIAPGTKSPVTSGTLIFDEPIDVPDGGSMTFDMSVFVRPPGRTLRFVPQAFALAPTSTHLYVQAVTAVVKYRVGSYVTGKLVNHHEWTDIEYVLTSEPDGQTSLRILIEDSETRDMFGPGLVEIFPGGPFGEAIHGSQFTPAESPFIVPLSNINGIDFAVDEAFTATDSQFIDEISVRIESR